jgi:hypothetical protein
MSTSRKSNLAIEADFSIRSAVGPDDWAQEAGRAGPDVSRNGSAFRS